MTPLQIVGLVVLSQIFLAFVFALGFIEGVVYGWKHGDTKVRNAPGLPGAIARFVIRRFLS